jgi:hypothetical protein
MTRDDDVGRLFSWLQTPEVRYREFAGARELTEVPPTLRLRSNTAEGLPPEENPPVVAGEAPKAADAAPAEPDAPPPPLEAAAAEPVVASLPAPPLPQPAPAVAEQHDALGPPGSDADHTPAPSPPEAALAPPPQAAPAPALDAAGEGQQPHTLSSVFSRLSGGRRSDSDPRDRIRHIPGWGPKTGRPR